MMYTLDIDDKQRLALKDAEIKHLKAIIEKLMKQIKEETK